MSDPAGPTYVVNRYISKVYDPLPADRIIMLVRKDDHWPKWFTRGCPIDIDANMEGLGTIRIFGVIVENSGHVLRIETKVMGQTPTKVWSMP